MRDERLGAWWSNSSYCCAQRKATKPYTYPLTTLTGKRTCLWVTETLSTNGPIFKTRKWATRKTSPAAVGLGLTTSQSPPCPRLLGFSTRAVLFAEKTMTTQRFYFVRFAMASITLIASSRNWTRCPQDLGIVVRMRKVG